MNRRLIFFISILLLFPLFSVGWVAAGGQSENVSAKELKQLKAQIQALYDFETNDFSAWIGVELGKMLAPGRIAYIKPGWGIDNSELTDREFTFEVGFRWFF